MWRHAASCLQTRCISWKRRQSGPTPGRSSSSTAVWPCPGEWPGLGGSGTADQLGADRSCIRAALDGCRIVMNAEASGVWARCSGSSRPGCSLGGLQPANCAVLCAAQSSTSYDFHATCQTTSFHSYSAFSSFPPVVTTPAVQTLGLSRGDWPSSPD